jgi:hypothetical protein
MLRLVSRQNGGIQAVGLPVSARPRAILALPLTHLCAAARWRVHDGGAGESQELDQH